VTERRTEQDLWHAIKRVDRLKMFTRIESAATVTGASDTTYRTEARHGWIELKTCKTRRDARWVPDHPLSVEQLAWIGRHHKPLWRMFSYVLIGRYDASARFDAFALIAPVDAVALMNGATNATPRPTWLVTDSVMDIMDHLMQYAQKE